MTDTTLSDLTGTVREVQEQLRDRYKATKVRIITDDQSGDVTVRLEFHGFTDLEAALDRVGDVAIELEHNHGADVNAGVSDTGMKPEDDPDHRPSGWVSATFVEE